MVGGACLSDPFSVEKARVLGNHSSTSTANIVGVPQGVSMRKKPKRTTMDHSNTERGG